MLGYVLLHTNTVQWNGGDLYIEGGSMVMYVFFSQNAALNCWSKPHCVRVNGSECHIESNIYRVGYVGSVRV